MSPKAPLEVYVFKENVYLSREICVTQYFSETWFQPTNTLQKKCAYLVELAKCWKIKFTHKNRFRHSRERALQNLAKFSIIFAKNCKFIFHKYKLCRKKEQKKEKIQAMQHRRKWGGHLRVRYGAAGDGRNLLLQSSGDGPCWAARTEHRRKIAESAGSQLPANRGSMRHVVRCRL